MVVMLVKGYVSCRTPVGDSSDGDAVKCGTHPAFSVAGRNLPVVVGVRLV